MKTMAVRVKEEKTKLYDHAKIGGVTFDLSAFFDRTAEQMWNEGIVPLRYDIAIGLDTYITLFYESCGHRGYLTSLEERRDISRYARSMYHSLELLYALFR